MARNEKIILSSRMAAYLVLNNCKLNCSKADLKDPSKLVYFFEDSEKLSKLMGSYDGARQQLAAINNEAMEFIKK